MQYHSEKRYSRPATSQRCVHACSCTSVLVIYLLHTILNINGIYVHINFSLVLFCVLIICMFSLFACLYCLHVCMSALFTCLHVSIVYMFTCLHYLPVHMSACPHYMPILFATDGIRVLFDHYGMPSSHAQFMWFFATYLVLFVSIR